MLRGIDEELSLRTGLFSHDLINRVIGYSKDASCLDNKEELYGKLRERWWLALGRAGGVPTPYDDLLALPQLANEVRDPRLTAQLPPLPRKRGAGGRPPPFLSLVRRRHRDDAVAAQLTKTYSITEGPAASSTMREEEEEAVLEPIGRKRAKVSAEKSAREAPPTPTGCDLVVGALVLLEGRPGRVAQIFRPRSGPLLITVRFCRVHTSLSRHYLLAGNHQDDLREEADSADGKAEKEVVLPWGHHELVSPFSSSTHSSLPVEMAMATDATTIGPSPPQSTLVPDSMEALLDDLLGGEDLLTSLPTDLASVFLPDDLLGTGLGMGLGASEEHPAGEVLLATGEQVSARCLEDLEEYFSLLRQTRKKVVVNPIQNGEADDDVQLLPEEDPDVPPPPAQAIFVGHLRKMQRKGEEWVVTLEDLYCRPQIKGLKDYLLPVMRLRVASTFQA
eukprot:gene2763-3016_t